MKRNEITGQGIALKAYSGKEVAGIYQVSSKTLRTWLNPFRNEIGQRYGHYYTPRQVRIIFEKLGTPAKDFLN